MCRSCKSLNFRMFNVLNSGEVCSLYVHVEHVIVLIAFFCKISSLCKYFLYVFPHKVIPYNRYGWIKLYYNIFRFSLDRVCLAEFIVWLHVTDS